MSDRTYNAIQRGKLVKVAADDSLLVYLSPSKKSAEYITGPKTVGTATGYTYTEGKETFQEVIRSAYNPFLPTAVEVIYLNVSHVELAVNPDYDPAKDTDRPTEDDPSIVDKPDSKDPDVSTVPGAGRIPVTAADGKTVYVLVRDPAAGATTVLTDPNRKWIAYGLYGVLGLAVVALLVIVLRKPKPQPKLLPAS